MSLFAEIEKLILKFKWKPKRPQISKAILSKKGTTGGHNPRLQIILQSHSNINNMVVVYGTKTDTKTNGIE
jgi:hypothetical protein